jgi:alanine-synthesizing transaminase
VTLGVKEGLAHLALAMVGPGDVVLAPTPTYPIHMYSVIIAGGEVRGVELGPDSDFFENLQKAFKQTQPAPRALIISFPHNPTTRVVDLEFFKKVVEFALEHQVWVIHDLAYADIVFDGYKAPSLLQIPEAKQIGVEFYSLSKSYNMPGWRVGFCVGNREVIGALTKIKSYLDYGMFQPIQIASIIALNGPQDCVKEIVGRYERRRNALVRGLNRIGWPIDYPRATMFAWAKIPQQYLGMGSLEFSKLLLPCGIGHAYIVSSRCECVGHPQDRRHANATRNHQIGRGSPPKLKPVLRQADFNVLPASKHPHEC